MIQKLDFCYQSTNIALQFTFQTFISDDSCETPLPSKKKKDHWDTPYADTQNIPVCSMPDTPDPGTQNVGVC